MPHNLYPKSLPAALWDSFWRRIFDIAISVIGLAIASPVLLFAAIQIKRDSPGPVIYGGPRMGRGGREFRILKFRTMYEDQKSYAGPPITGQGDPRITPIGKWLRDTKINELPQFWNVLRGEMSLVGPRPEDPEIVKTWHPEVRDLLLSVKPGITSPASVIYRDEESMLQSGDPLDDYLLSILPTKLRLDSLYLRSRTLLTDLDVIFWTLIVLIPQARDQPIPETKLYWGPLSIFFNHFARWFFMDFIVALASVALVGVTWRTLTPLDIGWAWAPLVAFAIAAVFSLANMALGTHRTYWKKARPSDAIELALSTAAAAFVLWLGSFLIARPAIPPGLFLYTGFVAFAGFVSVRYRERILTGIATRWLNLRRGPNLAGEPILIIGAGELGAFATWLVRKGDFAQAFSIVGMLDDDPRKQGMRYDGVRVIGTTADLPALMKKHEIGIVLFAIANIAAAERQRILDICTAADAKLVMITDIVRIMREYFTLGIQPGFAGKPHPGEVPGEEMNAWLRAVDNLLAAGDVPAARALIAHLLDAQPDPAAVEYADILAG
jgi:lipopolysaccharide/colanic/teichoic acid biosynthesis glycosyltransferase